MTPAPALHILILAAGAAARMRGADKLLEPVDGLPLLRKLALAAQETGLPVTIALPPDRPARTAALQGLGVGQITVPDPSPGLSASLIAGLADIPEHAGMMVLLADLPEIDAGDLAVMAAAHGRCPGDILRACAADGTPGHPVVFPPWAREALLQAKGDSGARDLLRAHPDRVRAVPLPANHATTDLDTPEAWADWRARTGR